MLYIELSKAFFILEISTVLLLRLSNLHRAKVKTVSIAFFFISVRTAWIAVQKFKDGSQYPFI